MDRAKQIREIRLLRETRKRQLERCYRDFFAESWKILEPETPLKDNWHIRYICDELQWRVKNVATKRPKTRDLIINLPPRSAKSHLVTICLTPWAWTRWPWLKFINSSYEGGLATDLCVMSRRIIESPWYQERWGGIYQLTTDQNTKSFYENDRRGHRIAVSVPAGVSGKGADIIISDDDLDVKHANSSVKREAAKAHFSNSLATRINDKEVGFKILVQQRLHDDDITGAELKKDRSAYDLICVPVEENDAISPPELKQFYRDGLFFPKRFSPEVIKEMRRIGAKNYSAQFLQKPVVSGGDAFPPENWKFYKEPPVKWERSCISWDMSFKKTDDASYTVGQVWVKKGPNAYLLFQWRQQCGFIVAKKAVLSVASMYPTIQKKLIEDKANGTPVLESLRLSVSGLQAVEPEGSKPERAEVHAPLVESGCIYLPDPEIQPWTLEFIDEFAKFDEKGFFDQIDAFSQAMDYLYGKEDTVRRLQALLS